MRATASLSFLILVSATKTVAVAKSLRASGVPAAERDGPPPRAHQLDESYTFERYLSHFDKSYDDPDEYDRRSAIFAKNMEKILRHNEGRMDENGDVLEGYVMGVNKFTDVETHELPMGYNKAHHPAWRSQSITSAERRLGVSDTITTSYSVPMNFTMDEVSDLPPSKDWAVEGKVNPTIPNQGGCGSCWTFATVGIMESHLAIATGEEPMSLSEQTLLQCTPNHNHCGGTGGCEGSTVELALNYVADQTANAEGGMFNLAEVPYQTYGGASCDGLTEGKTATVGVEGWTQLPSNNYKAMMNAVAKKGPVAIAVAASGWGMYESGIFDGSGHSVVNHAVMLVGYGEVSNGVDDNGEKYYRIRNSWGPNFGENGYIRIKRTDDDDNVCMDDTQPLEGIACALDDEGNRIPVQSARVCGVNAVLFDGVIPVRPHLAHPRVTSCGLSRCLKT